jgi:entericidin B
MRTADREETTMLRTVLLALVVGGIALAASGCNTVRGVGQDIESAANTVDRAT